MRWIRSMVFVVGSMMVLTELGQSASQYDLVKMVSERKMLMFDMQTAYLNLLAIRQERSEELASVAENALIISENMTKFVELLAPNSDVGKVPNSRAKAEIWSETEEFGAAVSSLETAAMQLSKIGQGASIDRFNEEFDALASACVVCHGLRPSSGGRFRSPKDG